MVRANLTISVSVSPYWRKKASPSPRRSEGRATRKNVAYEAACSVVRPRGVNHVDKKGGG